jgi:hypothetical protein
VNQRSTFYLERKSSFSSLLRDAYSFGHVVGLSAAEVHRQSLEARKTAATQTTSTPAMTKKKALYSVTVTHWTIKNDLRPKKVLAVSRFSKPVFFGRIPNLAIPLWLYLQ